MDLGDNELTLTPIPGKSGKAYMGSYPDGKRIFVKMNTSPILPGLAREQIAPQLLWSRRLADGRDMCAQEWLTGKILTPYDMNRKQIVNIFNPPTSLTSFDDTVESVGLCHGNTCRLTTVLARNGSRCFA